MLRAAILAVALLAAVPARAADWKPTEFRSDAGERVAAETTTVTVPERHDRPDGTKITLPVVRFRSTSAHPGPPIVYLAGGPGNSGIRRARQEIFPVLMRLRAAGDVIVWDQRGTGGASPSLMLKATYDLPADQAVDTPAGVARLAEIGAAAAAEIKSRGVDLSAYNTAENADDIEEVRAALGAEKIVLWGHSYGSHLGLAYLARHGGHVAKAMFGGVNDLGNRWRLPSDGDALLAHIDASLRADPRMAGRMPDFLGTARRVLDGLAAHPQAVAVGDRTVFVGRQEVRVVIALQAGDIFFVRQLPAMFARMDRGDFSEIGRMVAQIRATPLGSAMSASMHLASGVSPDRAALIAAEAPGSLMGDAINFPFNVGAYAGAWGVADLGEGFRHPPGSETPVLFMDGEFDGRTSVREAKETAARFSHACFVEMLGAGHDFYGFSPAVPDTMLAFLADDGCGPAQLRVLPTEFKSPDEAALLSELGQILATQGTTAAVERMKAMAAAKEGPYFNAAAARSAGFLATNQLKNLPAAIALLEAADELWPNDHSINRQLAALYDKAGDRARALARWCAVKAINPLTPGVDLEIAKDKQGDTLDSGA